MAAMIQAAATEVVARRPGGRTARVRRAVFDATLDLLASSGYQALTIESIAAAAGVNKSTIYRNWPTKATLILAATEDRSEALIRIKSTGDPEGDLVAFLTSVADSITSPLGRALISATIAAADDPEVQRARDAFWQHRFQAARDLVRTATKDERHRVGADVDLLIERLIAPLFLRVFITGAPVHDTFIRNTVRAALLLPSQ